MVIDVSEALDNDTAENITVLRTAAGGYIDGIYSPGAVSNFVTIAGVQQPKASELQKLPEGERNKDIRKFISIKELRTTNDRDGTIADSVFYNNIQYKIIMVEHWDVYGHSTAFGARIG